MKYRISGMLHIILTFFVLCIAITVCIFAYRSYITADQKVIRFDDQAVEAVYIGVQDIYGRDNTPSLNAFFSEENSLERMNEFNQFINANFNFFVFQMQPLITQGEMPYRDEFRIDYGQEYYGENDQFGYSLKSVQVNQKAYEAWGISEMIAIGTGYEDESFTQDEPQHVPAILGINYQELVSIGDVYPIYYYGEMITLQVIGFLHKDANVPFWDDIYYLDDCIMLPTYHVNYPASNEEEDYLRKIQLSQYNWGYIRMKNEDNYYDYKQEIEAKSEELDLLYITNEAYATEYIQNISSTLNSTKGAFLLVSLLLFLILSFIILYIFVWDYNKNKIDYAIHLVCGDSFTGIKVKIFSKALLLFITAFSCASWINYLMMGYEKLNRESVFLLMQAMRFSAILVSCVVIFICIILNIHINRNNVYTNIQEG